jgi:epoxyqueuosine reductase
VLPLANSAHSLPSGAAWHSPTEAGAPALEGSALAHAIRGAALKLGFARVGFCPVAPFAEAETALSSWLAAGHHGEMAYMAGPGRAEPAALLPAARTLITVALPYSRAQLPERDPGGPLPLRGLVARYARGSDYHDVMKQRLRALADRTAELAGRPVLARPCVDTAPLLEREAARRAGVGFTAKSTLTIVAGLGSYVLLGELLVDLEIAPTEPVSAGCGSCRTCLVACPTRAFVDAYTLDARRCISYLTIELAGSIPRELRPSIGRWVFGCDVCQEVCPFNQSPKPRASDPQLAAAPELSDPDLVALLELSSSGYRRLVRGTALRRVSRPRLQRNAAVALGNTRNLDAVVPLARALSSNPSSLVRGHVAWALGRLGGPDGAAALSRHRGSETDAEVLLEIEHAIAASVWPDR